MFNFFNPQSIITQFDTKTKEYTESVLETFEAFQISNIKSFDKMTGSMFKTYCDKTINTIKKMNEEVKGHIV
jgi:hypothetical protein